MLASCSDLHCFFVNGCNETLSAHISTVEFLLYRVQQILANETYIKLHTKWSYLT